MQGAAQYVLCSINQLIMIRIGRNVLSSESGHTLCLFVRRMQKLFVIVFEECHFC